MCVQMPRINPASTVQRRKQAEAAIQDANIRLNRRLHAIKASPDVSRAELAKSSNVSAQHKRRLACKKKKKDKDTQTVW
jgi:hypothetical protein